MCGDDPSIRVNIYNPHSRRYEPLYPENFHLYPSFVQLIFVQTQRLDS